MSITLFTAFRTLTGLLCFLGLLCALGAAQNSSMRGKYRWAPAGKRQAPVETPNNPLLLCTNIAARRDASEAALPDLLFRQALQKLTDRMSGSWKSARRFARLRPPSSNSELLLCCQIGQREPRCRTIYGGTNKTNEEKDLIEDPVLLKNWNKRNGDY